MGRKLKRVPLDFDYPLNRVWYGYYSSLCHNEDYPMGGCDNCKRFAKLKGLQITSYGCPDFEPFLGPPVGEGYQLWETTSEGSPVSPVFESLDELCEWCEDNATTFGNFKASKEEWKEMLEKDFFCYRQGNVVFI